MAGARILLVEDDPAIARSIIYTLERDGLSVTHSLLLGDARAQISRQPPDAVILDVGLPDGSGLDLCRELRAAGSLPVLMLSAQGEEIDRVLGLELGADDYVSKPFSPRELLARVRSLLRRARMPAPAPAQAASPFEIDTAGQRVSLHGRPLNLTRREFGLLADLLRHRGRIRSRDELLNAVWGAGTDSTDRTVDTHIKTLRAKLQEIAPGHDCITTHRGMGYSLDVDRIKGG
ncbi:two-component system response regulator CreB [Polaromonas sp. JS666]|uniref:two-component system response regulator CreB n=1 Tax=Polaromonas sp. (strain JS666 / ATCC BAA-500) TaxID=296591 RepID=UPI00088E0A96|nr:two-component system response regulator CreB [Polaromonas sp. JS666]SDN61990.1 two-component system, OmpR family, catabolic regulation response regulator CreB [Polaromonas sp. JS666]